MYYELPPWLSFAAPIATAAVVVFGLLMAGKVPLSYNFRNLIVRWKTTLLTSLAFTVVVALLIFMHAFASGISRVSEGSSNPANVICLSDGASDEIFSTLPINTTAELGLQDGVARDALNRPLCSREVYVIINQPTPVMIGDRHKHRFLQFRGVEEPDISAIVHGLELVEGDWFSEAGVRGARAGEEGTSAYSQVEVVIGESLARDIGIEDQGKPLEVGAVFEAAQRQCIVVGIMRGPASTFASEIWAKRQKIGEMFSKENLYTSVVLRAESPAVAQELADRLSHDFKTSAVSAMTESKYFRQMSDANKELLATIYIIAGIMALGGVFGVMNTMFAAIRQRTTDIGVLRLLGFARWQVLVSFLLESLLIAALGGLLGCALGFVVNGWDTQSVVGTSGGGMKKVAFKMIVDGNTLAAGVLFTLVMGILGGLLPAVSAMRLKPLESLR
jgi:ABC-type lipoprotein release transport system permease subunit